VVSFPKVSPPKSCMHLSSLHRPIYLVLFSDTFSLSSSLVVSDHVSHPYKTDKIIVLHILIFVFFDSKLEDKRFWIEW
jgi:hypothetical protein